MSEEAAFVAAISSGDMIACGVFADWLEERGDPRGALLRRRWRLWQKGPRPSRADEKTADRLASQVFATYHALGAAGPTLARSGVLKIHFAEGDVSASLTADGTVVTAMPKRDQAKHNGGLIAYVRERFSPAAT